METVFDHGISNSEIRQIGFLDKEKYLQVVDEQSSRFDLALLYHLRGELEKVNEYLEGLPPIVVNDFWRTVTHP